MKTVKMTEPHPKNQLSQVACYIMFPPTFSIEKIMPSLQEKLKGEYPMINVEHDCHSDNDCVSETKNYTFRNNDGTWFVSVSMKSLKIVTKRYTDWEEFSSKLKTIIDAFTGCHPMKDLTQIGIRFVSALKPSTMGYDAGDIFGIVKKKYADQMRTDLGTVENLDSSMDLVVGDGIICNLKYCAIKFEDGETGFMIDTYAFTENDHADEGIIGRLGTLGKVSKMAFCEMTTEDAQRKVGI